MKPSHAIMVSASEVEVFELCGCDGCVQTGPYINSSGQTGTTGKSRAAVETFVWGREDGTVLFWVCVYLGVTPDYARLFTLPLQGPP